MTRSVHVRPLRDGDLAFADGLRELAGWNQTLPDWRRFLEGEPGGCFLAEWEGEPAGTTTTWVHDRELAWVGMVLVHPRLRRRGIGQTLLEHALEYLRGRGVRSVRLDATPLGRPVYERFGFREEWSLTRWEHTAWAGTEPGPGYGLRTCKPADLERLEPLDAGVFGSSRRRLLAALLPVSSVALVRESGPNGPEGYAWLRPGVRARYLGPAVAGDAEAGLELVAAALGRGVAGRVYWDVPDANVAAAEWARAREFRPQRQLVRMVLGKGNAGDPRRQFAISGPETG